MVSSSDWRARSGDGFHVRSVPAFAFVVVVVDGFILSLSRCQHSEVDCSGLGRELALSVAAMFARSSKTKRSYLIVDDL